MCVEPCCEIILWTTIDRECSTQTLKIFTKVSYIWIVINVTTLLDRAVYKVDVIDCGQVTPDSLSTEDALPFQLCLNKSDLSEHFNLVSSDCILTSVILIF